MSGAERILRAAGTVLLVDFPSRDVPETLVRAGYTVFVKGGPEPDNYWVHELRDDQVVDQRTGTPPANADLVYAHRPVGELPGIVAMAVGVGAAALWYQSGLDAAGAKDPHGVWLPEDQLREASSLAEAVGLAFVHEPYIADEVRRLDIRR